MTDTPEVVLCFDRDMCVDINFPDRGRGQFITDHNGATVHRDGTPYVVPDDGDPVPLAWVQHWAHEQGLPVWATGNQHLRAEAKIPGLQEAEAVWEAYWTGEYNYDNDTTYYGKPQRVDGLRLIQDVYEGLFPDADIQFIVVDDVDVSVLEVDGWTHYFPWDFVEAVSDGAVPVSKPPTDTPVPGAPMQSNGHDYDYSEWDTHLNVLFEVAREKANV